MTKCAPGKNGNNESTEALDVPKRQPPQTPTGHVSPNGQCDSTGIPTGQSGQARVLGALKSNN